MGILEVVRNAASIFFIRTVEGITLAQPARVGADIVVPGVVWYTVARAAAIPRRPRDVPIGLYIDPGALACVDEGWYEQTKRRKM